MSLFLAPQERNLEISTVWRGSSDSLTTPWLLNNMDSNHMDNNLSDNSVLDNGL